MSSSSGAEGILTSPAEHQANAPVATAMDAKLIVATASGDVQQLKELVKKEESQMMVVVMAKQHAASMEKPQPQQRNIDPHLLALASSGSSEGLQTLLNSEAGQASGHGGGTDGGLNSPQASSYGDTEANESILEGVTAEGDTALHVVATFGQGDNFFTKSREAKHLLPQNWWERWRGCWCLVTRGQRHKLLTTYGYGDGDNFLSSADIIYENAKHLLSEPNNNGDTPLHCAARAGKSNMVKHLIDLAFTEGEGRVKELLRKENKHKETALHEAIRVGNKDIVDMLMSKDPDLASFPEGDGVTSPMYLATMLKQDEIVKTLIKDKSSAGKLSFSGPNGQNALHAAVLRNRDLRKSLLEWNERYLCPQIRSLTTQGDENGSTPLHFAAAVESRVGPSICGQLLEANPEALYQADRAGFFPIHVAASVGAFRNVDMFVKRCAGSAGLRDAKGRTFLHVAVEKNKVDVIRNACKNLSLSWIMNMVDNDGNTALHLAVTARSLHVFCPLLGNPQVNLDLPNNRGETPLDIAAYNLPERVFYVVQMSSIEAQLHLALTHAGALRGVCRHDHFKDNITPRVNTFDESKEREVLKESTEALCIGSVLIATMTFGATFAVPGGYIQDEHNNEGSPVLARRYAFHAFIISNTSAFVLSSIATFALMRSGNPLFNLWTRKTNLTIAYACLSNSITSLAAAFALAAYLVLYPVAPFLALWTCGLTSLILIYNQLELLVARFYILSALSARKGLIRPCAVSARAVVAPMLLHNGNLMVILGWAAVSYNQSSGIGATSQGQAPAPAPAPLAST